MKKRFVYFLLLPAFLLLSFAPANPDPKIFAADEIVWAGIDFSEARLIGSEGFSDPYDIHRRFFSAWNNLILSESDKYNIREFYKKKDVINDLSVVNERNEMPDPDELVINESYSFEEGRVEAIVKEYDLKKKEDGVGLVYIVESFDKTGVLATVNVVFFDIQTRKILWKEQYQEKPGGFGLRNYWAGAIMKVMKSSRDDYEQAQMQAK